MTLNDLILLVPEADRGLPLAVLDRASGYSFEVQRAEVDDDEYVAGSPPPPASMAEATRSGRHVLLDFGLTKRAER